MRRFHDTVVLLRLLADARAVQLIDDVNVARAAIAAHAFKRWRDGRRWFVIVTVESAQAGGHAGHRFAGARSGATRRWDPQQGEAS